MGFILALAADARADAFESTEAVVGRMRAFVDRHGAGVVVGLVDSTGRRILAIGASGRWDQPRVDASTRFEIGSISKTFTGLLLAEMVLRGEVAADTPIGALFPASIPLANGLEKVPLEALATHTSGLPRLPISVSTVARAFTGDPYRGLTPDDIFRAAAAIDTIVPTDEMNYSNLGVALLGQLLAQRAGQPFAVLLRQRVLVPLGLAGIQVGYGGGVETAQGHGASGRPTSAWHLDAYNPAGGLLASIEDMVAYIEIMLAAEQPAVALVQKRRRSFPNGLGIGLNWIHRDQNGQRIIWHNGMTGGFRAFAAFMPEESRGLVVLANSHGDVDALGRSLIFRGPINDEGPPIDWVILLITLVLLIAGPGSFVGALRRADQRVDRFELLISPVNAAFVLLIVERWGAWLLIPFTAWWISLGLSIALSGLVLARARRPLPWWRTGPARSVVRGLYAGLQVLVVVVLLVSR